MSSRYLDRFLQVVVHAARQQMSMAEIGEAIGAKHRQTVDQLYRSTKRRHWNHTCRDVASTAKCRRCRGPRSSPRGRKRERSTGLCITCYRSEQHERAEKADEEPPTVMVDVDADFPPKSVRVVEAVWSIRGSASRARRASQSSQTREVCRVCRI